MRTFKRFAILMMQRVAPLLFIVSATCANAHDFWLQPAGFWLPQSGATPMTLQVGHGSFRQRSPIALDRVTRLSDIEPDGTAVDRMKDLHLGEQDGDGTLRLDRAGTHLVVFQTDNRAQSHLPSIRFNDYLAAEGLTTALEARRRNGRMEADGSENYGRIAKAIVQIGAFDATAQKAVTEPLGLPLEIVPERNPYAEPRASALPVHVIYEGHPLHGALVKLIDLDHDAKPVETHVTDSAGRVSSMMPAQGSWLINVIWTKSLPASSETDFSTTFSSLSFGFPPLVH